MKTLREIGCSYQTDKVQSGLYVENYEKYFAGLRERPISLLELGVYKGGSLQMWHDYFSSGKIVGLDINPNPLAEVPERVKFYQGSQDNAELLKKIVEENAPDGFDIIIDDAAHIGTLARASYAYLFSNHLKTGGIYVIEDWGTGYWGTWPDGVCYQPAMTSLREKNTGQGSIGRYLKKLFCGFSSPVLQDSSFQIDDKFSAHNFGMVGFVKELVDHLAWGDITWPRRGREDLSSLSPPAIREISFFQGQVFITRG